MASPKGGRNRGVLLYIRLSSDTDADLASAGTSVACVCCCFSGSDVALSGAGCAQRTLSSLFFCTDREVNSAATLDVFPVYERSPDTSYYVPVTSPVTPLSSEGVLPLLDPESLSLGATASLDSLLENDIIFLDRDVDLSLLAVPLLPLPDDLQLLPDIALERRPVSDSRPLPPEPCSPVVSPP